MWYYVQKNRQIVPLDIIPCLPPGFSFLRISHLLPQLGLVSVYLNDRPIIQLNYKDFSSYFPVVPGTYNFRFYSTKDNTLLFEIKDLEVPTNQLFTIVITGSLQNLQSLLVTDDINQRVDSDETKVRIYNLTLSKISASISSSAYNKYGELLQETGTSYLDIVPGVASLQVQLPNGNTQTTNLNLSPGRIYTIYIAESLDPTSPFYKQGNILQFIQVVDGNTLLVKCI